MCIKHISKELTGDAPKLLALKTLINHMGENIYGRPEKLLIFTSLPVVSRIVALVWLPSFLPVHLDTKKLAVAQAQLSQRRNNTVLIRRPIKGQNAILWNSTSSLMLKSAVLESSALSLSGSFRTLALSLR